MTKEFLNSTGFDLDHDRLLIAGLDDAPAFNETFIACSGVADVPAIRKEVLASVCEVIEGASSVGALLLECSELPPYAADIQQATGLPVFDFTSLIEFFAAGLRRAPFRGFY